MKDPIVVCADIGSVARNRFGWSSSSGLQGTKPSETARFVAECLDQGLKVALGFECPLFVPIRENEGDLTKARLGEGDRAWSAGAGCGVLATGLVQVVWILRAIRSKMRAGAGVYLDWNEFVHAKSGLLIWEAFVTKSAKGKDHRADARLGMEAFLSAMPDPCSKSIARPDPTSPEIYSLIGAALLRTGWSQNPFILGEPCLVISA